MSATITATVTSNAVSEYQLILNKSLEKEEDFDTISEHFAEALRKPEVQEQTIKDIRELTKTVKEIKEAFRKIGEGFVEFDGAKFLDNDNNLLQLGGQWREYQTVSVFLHHEFRRTLMSVVYSGSRISWTGVLTTRAGRLRLCTVRSSTS